MLLLTLDGATVEYILHRFCENSDFVKSLVFSCNYRLFWQLWHEI